MDIFKIFRSCFCCKEKKELLVVAQPGYEGTHYCYYHEECLQKVLKDPEKYVYCLDSAIQITDQIQKEENDRQDKLRTQLIKMNRLKNVQTKEKENAMEDIPEKVPEKQKLISKFEFIS